MACNLVDDADGRWSDTCERGKVSEVGAGKLTRA
jgi:hypothetical protein